MTIRDAKLELSKLGMILKKTEWGDFQVNFKGGSKYSAYYTDDLDDAVATARLMYEKQPKSSRLVSSMNRFSASKTLDHISDHLDQLRQEIPREASNLRGMALRLDRVANTIDQHSVKISLRKNAMGFLGAGGEENLSEFAKANRFKRQQIQKRYEERMLDENKAQFFGALLKFPEYYKKYSELKELIKQGLGDGDVEVSVLASNLSGRTGVHWPNVIKIAELDIQNAL